MKKNTFAALAVVVMLCLLAGCSQTAFAADIPASVSADYTGVENACRVEAYAASTQHRALDVKCTRPSDKQTTGVSVVNGCPSDSTLVPLTEWGSSTESDKLSASVDYFDWVDASGREVRSFGFGILSKWPAEWIRVVASTSNTLTVRIGGFAQLQQPDGGSLLLFNRVGELTPANTYPGCGASLGPVKPIRPLSPWEAQCASAVGCGQ